MLPLTLPTIPEWLAGVSAADLITTVLWVVVISVALLKGWPVMRRLNRVVDILLGAPATGGVPRQPGIAEVVMGGENRDGSKRPGLVDRIGTIEDHARDAAYNSKPNGGGSAFDSLMTEVRGVRIDVLAVQSDVADVKQDVAAVKRDVAVVQDIVHDHDAILSPDGEA